MDPHEKDELFAKIAANPEIQAKIFEIQKTVVNSLLEPEEKRCALGAASVERDGTMLHITWSINSRRFESAHDCGVFLKMWSIDLYPNANTIASSAVELVEVFEGEYDLQCEEGNSFLLSIIFTDHRKNIPDKERFAELNFPIAIPLASETRAILKKALAAGKESGALAAELESFLKKDDVFEEASKAAIEKIRSRGYPPDVEERKIAEFEDFARTAREKYGL